MSFYRTLGLILALGFAGSACAVPETSERGSASSTAENMAVLPLVHERQERLLCVPTAASMILAYRGDPHSPRALKLLALDRTDASEAELHSITAYRDIVRAVSKLGHHWREKTFANSTGGFRDGS